MPLADGTVPVKDDWVFSTKDGSYAQVLNPNVVGFAGKGIHSPDMVKVKIQDPATGKWKQSNRKRATLVKVAGPGEAPFVMETKAVETSPGEWIGPGSSVYLPGTGDWVKVLDTTTDGKVKVAADDGTQKWVDSKTAPINPVGLTGNPTLKQPAGTKNADELNAQLATLNDEHAQLAALIAGSTVAKPKKKKDIGVPYPGPAGMTVKQPAWLAEQREAKGLKNTKDGYVPTPGMILRHNDGTQYVVLEMGDDWTSHKNSVQVAPVASPYDYKWRALSTMVVDHETMLTDKEGNALPIISNVVGFDPAALPTSGMVYKKDFNKNYYQQDPISGKTLYRNKQVSQWYVVSYDGTVYNADGTKASQYAIQATHAVERVGYLDKDAPGGKTMTVSVQEHHNASVGKIQYAVIHDPDDSPGVILATPTPVPETPTPAPTTPDYSPTTVPTPEPATPETAPRHPGRGAAEVRRHQPVRNRSPAPVHDVVVGRSPCLPIDRRPDHARRRRTPWRPLGHVGARRDDRDGGQQQEDRREAVDRRRTASPTTT